MNRWIPVFILCLAGFLVSSPPTVQAADEVTEIFLYDGTQVVQLTSDEYTDLSPELNGNGHVVWSKRVRHDMGGWVAVADDVFLYDGTTTTMLSTHHQWDLDPQINAGGTVVWRGYQETGVEIYLHDGTGITNISNNDLEDAYPRMNDGGNGGPPLSKGTPGRDHWGNAMSVLMGGGGVRGGQIVGSTNRLGEAPQDRPLQPGDVHHTIFHVLGVDPKVHFKNHSGRPIPAVDHGDVISELI